MCYASRSYYYVNVNQFQAYKQATVLGSYINQAPVAPGFPALAILPFKYISWIKPVLLLELCETYFHGTFLQITLVSTFEDLDMPIQKGSRYCGAVTEREWKPNL